MKGRLNRRAWFASVGAGLAVAAPAARAAQARPATPAAPAGTGALTLDDFHPRSMLVVPEHPVERARFPVVDFHTHPTFRAGASRACRRVKRSTSSSPPAELLPLMDRSEPSNPRQPHRRRRQWARRDDPHLSDSRIRTGSSSSPSRPTIASASLATPRGRPTSSRVRKQAGARGREDPQGARACSCASGHAGAAGEGGRPAVRSDVGGVRRTGAAGGDPRVGPDRVLPAHRRAQRALRRAAPPSRLVVPRQGLSLERRDPGSARSRDGAPPEDHVRRPARRARV